MLYVNTTLDDIYQQLRSQFTLLADAKSIQLRETNIMQIEINQDNFAITKEILISSVDNIPSFIVTTPQINHIPAQSPSPLPPPYTQSVNTSAIISQPFGKLNGYENKNNIQYDNTNPKHINIMNAEEKMKSELVHRFRGGGNQILPLKPQKLFNFIRNNKAFVDDNSIDDKTLESVINNVVKWWFKHGLKRMALDDDNHDKNDVLDQKEKELKGIDLMLQNLGVNTIHTRNYQHKLFEAAIKGNIICFMPTGSGKTRIAIKFIEYRLKTLYANRLKHANINDKYADKYVRKYIIFLVCTTHLAEQQKNAIKKAIPFGKIRKIIGENNPDAWKKNDWQNELDYYDIFVMMHDCLKSALSHGYITMNCIDTLILDECHHVIGSKSNQSHPYTVIMEKYHQYKQQYSNQSLLPRIIGLTASPIKSKELLSSKIIQKARQLQTLMDAQLMRVDDDELQLVISNPLLLKYYYIPLNDGEKVKYFDVPPVFVNKINKYAKMVKEATLKVVVNELGVYGAAVCMRLINQKLKHKDSKYLVSKPFGSNNSDKIKEKTQALELFKRYIQQQITFFDAYLQCNQYTDSKWLFNADISMKLSLLIKFIADSHCGIEPQIISDNNDEEKEGYNPELNILFNKDSSKQQGIIFVKQRIVAYVLQTILSIRFGHIKFGVLTGHSCRLWGLNDKQQCKVINKFKNGDIDYLIATSVAEEGIDIQACNCVIMYHLPDTIKSYIQARGRARDKSSKYVLFIDTNNQEEQQRVDTFEETEREMIQQANNDTQYNESKVDCNRYEYVVTQTQAFASTVNAISMLQRYFDYLAICNTDIIKTIEEQNGEFKYIININSMKWKLKQNEFKNNANSKKEAERKCAVDIIRMLREEGLWDVNLVPVEILRKNKETQLMQKERALFQSVDIEELNVPSVINKDFQCQVDKNDKIGYLYYIKIHNDPNAFPMGIILPKPIPDEFLKSIHFPVQIRKRNDKKTCEDVYKYSMLIYEQLQKLESAKRVKDKDSIDKPKMESNDNNSCISYYMKTNVSLQVAAKNNVICVSCDRFDQLMEYHKLAFKLLDHGGTKNKKQLIPETNEIKEHELKDETEQKFKERFYLICPLKSKENGNRFIIDWHCIKHILNLQEYYEINEPNGVSYCNEYKSNIEYELIQTRNDDKTHQNLYISYGIHDLFSSQSKIPISGQIIADCITEESRMNKILHSNLQLDENKNNNHQNEKDIPLDEIDLNAQNTQLNKLTTTSIDENYKKLMLSTKYTGQQQNNDDDRVIIARRYSPKIRNILIQSRKKSKNSKSKMKSSVMFIPLKNVFPTGISTSHWYQLLNIPSIIWRLENYFNILDAQNVLKSMCNVSIDTDLLFESLCNAQAGTNKTYEKLECLGDRVLKFLVVLQGVFTMPNAHQGDLTIWESNIVSNINLDNASISINLPSYGIFSPFNFELWNPSYFKQRHNNACESLYKNIKISLKLPADIIESTIGALWCTLNDTGYHNLSDKHITMAINSCRVLLRKYELLKTDFKIDETFKKLINDWNDKIDNKFQFFSENVFQEGLKTIKQYIEDDCGYKLNLQYPLVTASLIELIDKCYKHHEHSVFAEYGITYQRLEFLGDAILDIIVTQFLYNNASFRCDLSIEGQITSLRSKIVGNDSLGFNLQDSMLDECIIWDEQQQIDINKYKQEIETLENKYDNDFWYLRETNVKCPKCLGDAFEVLLAIIFIDSNYNNLFVNDDNVDDMNLEYSLNGCIQFVCGFHDFARKYWSQKE